MEKKSNFLNDLEVLKINKGKIYSLGKKTFSLENIDGRFWVLRNFQKNN